MTPTIVGGLGAVVAVAAALRSTWSPCGLSMLSTLTPVAERARGRRFGVTAAWFVVGALTGGLTLGAGAAVLATAVRVVPVPATVIGMVALVGASAAAAVDAGLVGPTPPHRRRQVNERWLDRYRGWVVGVGYGWQLGAGLATYVMTCAVYLLVGLAAASGRPVVAVAVGLLFGAVRGLAVLATVGVDGPNALAARHRLFDRSAEPVRWAVVAVQAAVAVVAAALTWGAISAGLVIVAALLLAWRRPIRRRAGTDRTTGQAAPAARSRATAS